MYVDPYFKSSLDPSLSKSLELDLFAGTGMWFGTTLAQINQKE
jgi:hypothetical protein